MNASQIASIVIKALLAGATALAAIGWVTPEQVQAFQESVAGLLPAISTLVAVGLSLYSITRSILSHKSK